MFESGIKYYTTGLVAINFPEDNIVCHWCPLLDREFSERDTRYYCKRTGEFIPAPKYMIGTACPIDLGGNDND